MTKQVQRRRGTATQHTSFTGAEGETSVNTTNKSVHVHDGATAGGIEAARADLVNVSDASLNAALTGNTVPSLTITTADINGGTVDGTVIGGTTAAAVTGTSITAGDMFITGPSPLLRLTDNDASDNHTTIKNNNGSTYIDGRNDTANGDIVFRGTGGGVADEYARLTSAGKLGIGTNSPAHPLEIETDGDTIVRIGTTGTGDADAVLIIDANDTGEPEVKFNIDGVEKASISYFDSGNDLNIMTASGSGGSIDFQPNNVLAMRIESDGDVKIYGDNTTTDTRTLLVESEGFAAIRINGDLSDTSGETGGASLQLGIDGNSGTALVSSINADNDSGHGTTYTGTTANSMLVGTKFNHPIYFGVNSQVYSKMDTNAINVGGLLDDTFPSNNDSGAGVSLRYDGRISAVSDNTTSLNIGRHSGAGAVAQWYYAGSAVGSISVTGSATAYNTSSDYRLKENVTPIQGASDIVQAMRPCTYTAIADGVWYDGFLAHELQEVLPRAVTGTKDAMMDEEYEVIAATDTEEAVMGTRSVPNMQSVDYAKLTPLLVAALQEALARIEVLETRITALEGQHA